MIKLIYKYMDCFYGSNPEPSFSLANTILVNQGEDYH